MRTKAEARRYLYSLALALALRVGWMQAALFERCRVEWGGVRERQPFPPLLLFDVARRCRRLVVVVVVVVISLYKKMEDAHLVSSSNII